MPWSSEFAVSLVLRETTMQSMKLHLVVPSAIHRGERTGSYSFKINKYISLNIVIYIQTLNREILSTAPQMFHYIQSPQPSLESPSIIIYKSPKKKQHAFPVILFFPPQTRVRDSPKMFEGHCLRRIKNLVSRVLPVSRIDCYGARRNVIEKPQSLIFILLVVGSFCIHCKGRSYASIPMYIVRGVKDLSCSYAAGAAKVKLEETITEIVCVCC